MRKIIILLTAVLISMTACAQNTSTTQNYDGKYRLYQTENIWTFLKLDTETGKIWQLQYAINSDNAGEVTLNTAALNKDGKVRKGRFELYPTKNMYNFLLLDKDTGAVYQIQWSLEAANRGVVDIISE